MERSISGRVQPRVSPERSGSSNRPPTHARLTTKYVQRLKAGPVKTIVWDEPGRPNSISGFGLRITPRGTKSYILRVPCEGKSRYTTTTIGSASTLTCEEARARALHLREQHGLGVDVSRKERRGLTVSEAARRFLDVYRTRSKGRPIKDDAAWKCNLRRLTDALGDRMMDTVATADLQGIVDGMTKATAQAARSNWRTLWAYALDDGWLIHPANPARNVNIEACKETVGARKKELSIEQVNLALRAADERGEPVFALYLRVLMWTAHRPGELCRARWEGVDDGRVKICFTKSRKDKCLPKTQIPELGRVLARLREQTGEFDGLFVPEVNEAAAKSAYNRFRSAWNRLVAGRPELAGVRLKHFRSTRVTRAYRDAHDVALKAAQEAADHDSAKITDTYYLV